MEVRWTRKALVNLDQEAEYIAQDNPGAAARIVEQIRSSVQTLQDFPALGRPGRVSGTRELVISETPYIVPYRIREQTVEILRVLHSSRKWPLRF